MNHNLLSMLENRYTVLETSQVDHLAEPKMNMDITYVAKIATLENQPKIYMLL